jgi:hypothetical protein
MGPHGPTLVPNGPMDGTYMGPLWAHFGSIMGPDWAQTGSNIWAHRRFNQGPLTHFSKKKRNKRETAI